MFTRTQFQKLRICDGKMKNTLLMTYNSGESHRNNSQRIMENFSEKKKLQKKDKNINANNYRFTDVERNFY